MRDSWSVYSGRGPIGVRLFFWRSEATSELCALALLYAREAREGEGDCAQRVREALVGAHADCASTRDVDGEEQYQAAAAALRALAVACGVERDRT